MEWHLYREPRWSILNGHSQKLARKLDWLKLLSNTKFKHWPAKGREKEETQQLNVAEQQHAKLR